LRVECKKKQTPDPERGRRVNRLSPPTSRDREAIPFESWSLRVECKTEQTPDPERGRRVSRLSPPPLKGSRSNPVWELKVKKSRRV